MKVSQITGAWILFGLFVLLEPIMALVGTVALAVELHTADHIKLLLQ